jgi:hypothetical protein
MRTQSILIAALMLAACNPQEQARQVEAAAAPGDAALVPEGECARVAELFDDLVKRKAGGWVEADALAELSARGDYSAAYVVDGVFGTRFGPGGSASARADTVAACRKLASGGTIY